MSYSSRNGKRPDELASKSSHSHIINDEEVKSFLQQCAYPKSADQVALAENLVHTISYPDQNPIEHIIAVDGGYTSIPVKKTFPSSLITFFQFGELLLNTRDLDEISLMPFISREAMSRIKELERRKLVLPTKNVSYNNNLTLVHAVRRTIHDFFNHRDKEGNSLAATLQWLIYEGYDRPLESYVLSRCPHCTEPRVRLMRNSFNQDYISRSCTVCNKEIYLIDIFRLHEAVDNELGAGGILGYLTNLIEQMNIIHTIRFITENKSELLEKFLFIKDGPLAFFGQTANMHEPVRRLCSFLFKKHNLFLAGLEKSGAFVEHADEIKHLLKPGEVFLLDNRHIYTYILPGPADNPEPYAHTSYYSAKLIFKSRDERMYVITLPVDDENIVLNPQLSDFRNIGAILFNIEKMRCDMYDNSIVPIALANKLISLSNHPTSIILEKFAKKHTK
ncbi:DNA double-strand break repair nuclease NurA [Pedobacter alluvionis]|uniref:NurA domain-containing protein n=1 Tax=Pedobacter alluvionis TaxID=475253 RepID=A0A497XVJ9_9SPHI|nr:DNA double-strand break repair nuclease NurA [Pedobacter alluvionis]RLJ73664.1 NurA domain-containing protein [Pedobacter alluvionis]TFB32712.1 NurA domain-containing protein [Pedobacter alluvionis]